MFAYEGLGSIYWHMVGKLLLATQERFLAAAQRKESAAIVGRLADHYYRIRQGIGGFNKRPEVYGAFPLDPYSHTPSHSGARQPGMTGQVKEEVISRQGELGVVVRDGCITFRPGLLRRSEFLREPATFETFDVGGEPISLLLESGTLVFTYCQVPVVYHQDEPSRIVLTDRRGDHREIVGETLDRDSSAAIFERTGSITRIDVFDAPRPLKGTTYSRRRGCRPRWDMHPSDHRRRGSRGANDTARCCRWGRWSKIRSWLSEPLTLRHSVKHLFVSPPKVVANSVLQAAPTTAQ